MNWNASRIGITGASGFVGSHLHSALARKNPLEIRTLTRTSQRSLPSARENAWFAKGLDLVFHLAGVNRGTDEEILAGNILATSRLIEGLTASGNSHAHLVFASSSQVYSLNKDGARLTERSSTNPNSVYGIAKKTCEQLIRRTPVSATILRIANVYGPGCRPYYNSVIATLCDRTKKGEPLTLHGTGAQGRDFVFVDDVVRAMISVGERREVCRGKILNVSSGKIVSLKQIVDKIRKEVPQIKVQYQKQADAGGVSYCCNSSRLSTLTGWKPKTSLGSGIRQTLDAS